MSPAQVLVFSESLVPTVRKALCDPLEEVREAAAKTFEQLHATIGHQALDDILPTLLKQLVSWWGWWRGDMDGKSISFIFVFVFLSRIYFDHLSKEK